MERFQILADEHVPRVFLTVLEAEGFEVETVQQRFGQRTDDRRIIERSSAADLVLLTNARDFLELADIDEHAGLVLYSDWTVLLDAPRAAASALGEIDQAYSQDDFRNRVEWLDGWIDQTVD